MNRTISFRLSETVRGVVEAEARRQQIGVTTLLRRIMETWAREASAREIRLDVERVARISADEYLDGNPAEWYPPAARLLTEHPDFA